jgi:hypothetical protein
MRLIEPPAANETAVRVTPAGRVVAAVIALVGLALLVVGSMQGLRGGRSITEVVGPVICGVVVAVVAIIRRRRQRQQPPAQ